MLKLLTTLSKLQMKPLGMDFLAAMSHAEEVVGDDRVTIFAPTNEAFAAAAHKFGGALPDTALAEVCQLLLLRCRDDTSCAHTLPHPSHVTLWTTP